MIRKQFTLYLEHKPGALAAVAARLAKAKINIDGVSAYSSADVALAQIVVDDAAKTRKVLAAAKVPFTVQDVALMTLRNEVGSLATVTAKLAEAGININYVYATGCLCSGDCNCGVVISAPDLKKVEQAWRQMG
jgi:hypothetical protein